MMQFDASVNLGQILTMVTWLVSGAVALGVLRQSMTNHGERLGSVENELKKQTDILVSIGKQDQRLNDLERRTTSLETKRGRGSG